MKTPLVIKPAEGNRDFVSIYDADNNRIVVAILLKDAQDIINACNSRDQLVTMLAQCLNFIEHSQANSGKVTNAEEWARNVAEFRKNVAEIGIGRGPVPEAECNLKSVRSALAAAGVKL